MKEEGAYLGFDVFCPRCKAPVKDCTKISFGKVKCKCTSCGTHFIVFGGEGIMVVDEDDDVFVLKK